MRALYRRTDIVYCFYFYPLAWSSKLLFPSGLKGSLKEDYVAGTLSVEDVTELAHKVGEAHGSKNCSEAMTKLLPELPTERPYTLKCLDGVLYNLGMLTI